MDTLIADQKVLDLLAQADEVRERYQQRHQRQLARWRHQLAEMGLPEIAGGATGTAVSTGDIITAAKMNLKQETGVDLANLSINDTGADQQLAFVVNENLSADRTLNIIVNDADRTINLTGNIVIAATLTTTVAAITLAANAAGSSVTLPATGTLATLAGSENLTNKTLTSAAMSGTFTGAHTYSGILTLTAASMVLTAAAAFTLGTSDANSLIIQTNSANRWAFTGTIGQFTVYQTTGNYTLAFSDPAAARTITFPDPLGADSVAYIAATQTLTNKTITSAAMTGTMTGAHTYSGALTFTGASLTYSGTNIDTIVQDVTPHIDIGLDVFETGTVIDIAYDTAETLTGALIGINLDLSANVTISGQNVTGIDIQLPATYGAGTEFGIRVRGDGQTIQIGNDADQYLVLAKASSVDVNINGISPVVDIGADVLEGGIIIDVDYDTAEVLSSALTGISMDFGTNVTTGGAGSGNVTGYHLDLGPITFNAAYDGTLRGIFLEVDPTLTDEAIEGIRVTMSATYAAGTEYGLIITGDGETVSLVEDADRYMSMSKTGAAGINFQGIANVIDVNIDGITSGTLVAIDYTAAETLAGALIGIALDLATNVTLNAQNINGIILTMPAAYAGGTEVGIQVTGDGQTINISNDADLYISLAKASSVDINLQGVSPVIDIGADVLENGVIVDIDYDTAETLTGTSLIGVDINFNTNVTYATDVDVIGYQFQTAALTQSAANTTLIAGFRVNTAGALIQDTLAGVINWRGVDIQLPNATQTTGTVTVAGIAVTEGTTTSGLVVGAWLDVDIAIDLVTIGNRIDLDADNDTSLRASGDDILMWEVAGTDFMQWRLDGGVATLVIQAGTATEIAFAVVNTAFTVGTSGSMVIPYLSTTGAAFTDAIGGDVNGAIGINYDSDTGPTSTLEVRSNGAWVSVAVSGYEIQGKTTGDVQHGEWYHPNQLLSPGWVDETVCVVCGERMAIGNAITMYGNYWMPHEEAGPSLHAVFGHTHLERDPQFSSLEERVEALEEAQDILRGQVRELGAVPVA